MCGLGGIFSVGDKSLERNAITRFKNAFNTIKHRGPDHTNVYESDKYILGHHRLSIVDRTVLSNQPFTLNNEYTCIFNGEIYNYIELKRYLNENFDAEVAEGDGGVLIAGYKSLGKKFFSLINGMFSIIIIDHTRNELVLVRDVFGIKPLFYSNLDQILTFSEIKAFIKVDAELYKYSTPEVANIIPDNVFSDFKIIPNVKIVEPGQIVTICLSSSDTNFDTINVSDELSVDSETGIPESLDLLSSTDLKLGVPFSGGIDSSYIGCWLNLNNRQICCASVFSEDARQEQEWREKISKSNSFSYTELSMASIIKRSELYVQFLSQCDIPPRSMSYFAQFALYEFFSHDRIKVALDGQGADELFGGYLKKSIKYAYGEAKLSARFYELSRNLWMFKDWKPLVEFIFGKRDKTYSEHIEDLRLGHLQYLVHFLDTNSAHFGIEARVPYLTAYTHLCVEKLDPKILIKKGRGKYPIRKLASVYLGDLAWIKKKFGFRAGVDLPDLSIMTNLISLNMLMVHFPNVTTWQQYSDIRSLTTDWILIKAYNGCKFSDHFCNYNI